MAQTQEEFDEVAQWPPAIETHFILLLHEEAKKGLQTSTLDNRAWVTIDNAIFSKFGKRYTVPKLRTKYNRLRKLHREFSKLLEHTGMGWDSKMNTVHAEEDIWATYIKKNPYGKRFKKKGCDHYEILGEIFNNTTATGQMHFASTQLPPNSSEERDIERGFVNCGAHIDIVNSDDEVATPTRLNRRRSIDPIMDDRTRKTSKTVKQTALDSALQAWTKTMIEKSEARAMSSVRTAYTVDDYLDKLGSISGIPTTAYLKACEKFVSAEWRSMFMKMSEENILAMLGLDPLP